MTPTNRTDPSAQWTRDDLPDVRGTTESFGVTMARMYFPAVDAYADAVVDHLNANGVSPASDLLSSAAECVLDAEGRVKSAKADADRWRRAHSIVESERDQAREERDEWEDRARAAERELADEYSQANQNSMAWGRIAAHPALRMDLLPEADHTYAGRVFERITWLAEVAEAVTEMKPAEAAEARTAPAVTRDEVKKAMADAAPGLVPYGACIDAVHALVSGADPAVFVVRESDLPEVQRREDGSWAATPGLQHYGHLAEPAALRRNVKNWMEDVAQAEAVARAIEAGQSTDPVEERADELAREFWKMLEPDDGLWIGYEDAHGEGGHPWVFIVDRIARHLAEQESKR